jgi:type VI secretion system protein ImpG
MTDELLAYFNSELGFLRKMGAEFARVHPDAATALGLSATEKADPHVERLLEGVAFLNARTRLKLDDDFPELCESLLAALYPHYQAPFPSCAVVELVADPSAVDPVTGYAVERLSNIDTAPLNTEAAQGEACRFRTCYPVTLWPVSVTGTEFRRQPVGAPAAARSADAAAGLRFRLESALPDVKLSEMGFTTLRLFLNGLPAVVNLLYEVVFRNCLRVVVAQSNVDPNPTILKPAVISPVGFAREEGLVDYPERSFLGYRLITEYFAFPEKYLFLDLHLPPGTLEPLDKAAEIFVLFNRSEPVLEQNVGGETLKLGCTPIINLYRKPAEPIRLRAFEPDLRVISDIRRPRAHEVYSIERVTATSPGSQTIEYHPFFSVRHIRGENPLRYWSAARKPSFQTAGGDEGTEVFLNLVDIDFRPDVPRDWTVEIDTLCVNRNLPDDLPFGGGEPRLTIHGAPSVSRVMCLTRPTRTRRQDLGKGSRWRLLSHLTLNHLSLAELAPPASDPEGARQPEAFREILRLYDAVSTAATASQIEGLANVTSRPVVGRVREPNAPPGFCRGIEVSLTFDEARFATSGIYLFASVLRRFLSLYCSLNSFVTTVAYVKQREGEFYRWPPLAGERPLL